MICAPCRAAGDLAPSIGTRPDVEREMAELHTKCPGGTWCDGQRRIPKKPVGLLKEERVLRPATADGQSASCMQCGVSTPDSMFCDLCGGVYCYNHTPPQGDHPCTKEEA